MSEYWVSHKKYLCKYCNIYIADDVPSRRQHESGLRHKGNVERFVRGLYKEGAKRKQDQEEEKRDMARIEQAAQAAYAGDVSAGHAKAGSSSMPARAPAAGPSKPAKVSNPYANYSTAESLGFVDPDEERHKAEAERRQTAGVAGDWEVVAIVVPSVPVDEEDASLPEPGPAAPAASQSESQKRLAEQDFEDTRRFKLRKKTATVGLGEIYDPGIIPINLKNKNESSEPSPAPQSVASTSHATLSGASGATEKPRWSARGWKRPGENVPPELEAQAAEPRDGQTTEDDKMQLKLEKPFTLPVDLGRELEVEQESSEGKQEGAEAKQEETVLKVEDDLTSSTTGGSLFRKRKLPAGRGRR